VRIQPFVKTRPGKEASETRLERSVGGTAGLKCYDFNRCGLEGSGQVEQDHFGIGLSLEIEASLFLDSSAIARA
jgi:hypothetical protein